ncbi:MAG TPA: hypothetical protein VFT37_08980 [Telluria sp.]|nr:hypothetical protein [Telluria sp.]
MSLIFALKLALVPSLIGGITLAGRRWGPAVAGWLSAFPVVAGPVLFFIAMDQGIEFAANAATGTLSAVLAILVFNISYAWAATRHRWQLCLCIAFFAYALAVLGLKAWAPSLPVGAVAVLVALFVAQRMFPPAEKASAVTAKSTDMHWRMLAGAVLVITVTHFSSALGPQLSGVLAMFPVMASVLVAFSHRHSGPAFAINLLRGTVTGYYAFAVFCIALALLLPRVGIATAFVASLAGAIAVQAISRLYLQRR